MAWVVTAIVVGVGTGIYIDNEKDKKKKAEEQRKKNLANAISEKETEYQGLADTYNQKVGSFNTALSGFGSQLDDYADFFDDLDITNVGNIYNTTKNQLNTLEDNLQGLSFDATKPNFSSTIYTDYGTGTINNLPTLGSAKTGTLDNYLNQVNALQRELKNVYGARQDELGRIADFQDDINKEKDDFAKTIGRYDISDFDMFNAFEDELDDYRASIGKFDSPLSTNFTFDDSDIRESLKGLRDDYAAEQKRIEDFGSTLTGYYDDYEDTLGGYNISNITGMDTLSDNIDDRIDDIRDFDSLLDFDFSGQLRGLTGLEDQLDALYGARDDELDRISEAEKTAYQKLRGYGRDIGRFDISDIDSMDDYTDYLEDAKYNLDNFESLLDFDFSDALDEYNTAQAALSQLYTDRKNEQDRISEFEKALLATTGGFSDNLSGYNIANIDEMNALQDLIDSEYDNVSDFDSLLDFDFSDELKKLDRVSGDLTDLYGAREDELDRISDAEKDALMKAKALDRSVNYADIYSLDDLDDLQGDIDTLSDNISGFESLLDFDFSGSNPYLEDAQSDLTGLYDDRQTALDDLMSPMSGYLDDLSGLELYDERGMENIRGDLEDIGYDLSRFTGGRVGDLNKSLESAYGDVDARLEELGRYRDDLEQKAQGLMEQVNSATYTNLDMLTDPEAAYEAQQAEIELYNAQQAMDELDAIMGRLGGERERLEADAAAVSERNQFRQDELQAALDAFGIPRFTDLEEIDPQTRQQILNYMQNFNNDDDEDDFVTNMPGTSFGDNVIRIG